MATKAPSVANSQTSRNASNTRSCTGSLLYIADTFMICSLFDLGKKKFAASSIEVNGGPGQAGSWSSSG